MLTEKINPYAFDLLYQEQQPIDTTIFAAPLKMLQRAPVLTDGGYSLPWDERNNPVDKHTPQDDDFGYTPYSTEKYKPELSIPSVLELETTDKTSRGVFESSPLRYNPVSIYNQALATPQFPLDATNLRNDSTDGLITYRPLDNSPLGMGYTGGIAYAQGSDPLPMVAGDSEIIPNEQPSDSCSWYDFPCKFAKVKGEATILIVGVIVLAIGIFALTR